MIKEAIVEADRLGFDGAVMPDHYMWGEMEWHKRPDSNSTLETWVTLTYLAAKTEQIRLGTLVTPIPFRSPSMLAKMLATLDILSKGRVVLGVGAGWSQAEFEGYSEWNEPKTRVDKTKEGIELMIRLWAEDKVTFEGRYYHTRAAVLEPKPVQKPHPALLFGGRGDRMLRLAGKYADICYVPQFRNGQSFEGRKAKVLEAAERLNRAGRIAFMAGGVSAEGPYRSEEYSRRIEAARETGASFFLTAFPRNEPIIDVMKRFAAEVLPSFR